MPKHRSLNLKKFVDSIPDNLMEEYLIYACSKIIRLEAYDYEAVNGFLESLTDQDLKNNILEDFTHINDLGERVMNILVKTVNKYDIETTGEETKQGLAMHLFLNHPKAFDNAYDHYCLFNASSKMSCHHLQPCDIVITPEKISKFRDRIIEFFEVDIDKTEITGQEKESPYEKSVDKPAACS